MAVSAILTAIELDRGRGDSGAAGCGTPGGQTMYSCCSRPVRRLLAPRITYRDLAALVGAPCGQLRGRATRPAVRSRHGGAATTATADTIFWGGPILTMASPQPTVEAIAIQDGRIIALGDRTTVR